MNSNPSTLWKLHKANTWPTRVSDNLRGNLLHFSLFPPIAYHHFPRWRCIHIGKKRKSQMIPIIFITLPQELTCSPSFAPTPLCKSMDYVWYACVPHSEVCVFLCMCSSYWLYSLYLRGKRGKRAVYTSMHACMHPCRDAPLRCYLSLHLSSIHRFISFGNEVGRER